MGKFIAELIGYKLDRLTYDECQQVVEHLKKLGIDLQSRLASGGLFCVLMGRGSVGCEFSTSLAASPQPVTSPPTIPCQPMP